MYKYEEVSPDQSRSKKIKVLGLFEETKNLVNEYHDPISQMRKLRHRQVSGIYTRAKILSWLALHANLFISYVQIKYFRIKWIILENLHLVFMNQIQITHVHSLRFECSHYYLQHLLNS